MVVAHRGGGMEGDRTSQPENSVAAVQSSIRLGVEMVELDIQQSSDGEFVVVPRQLARPQLDLPGQSWRNARWPS